MSVQKYSRLLYFCVSLIYSQLKIKNYSLIYLELSKIWFGHSKISLQLLNINMSSNFNGVQFFGPLYFELHIKGTT